MPRQRSVHLNLLPGMRARVRKRRNGSSVTYYFLKKAGSTSEIALGKNYFEAVQKWTELQDRFHPDNTSSSPFSEPTIKEIFERYILDYKFLKLSDRTKKDYMKYKKRLFEYFNDPPVTLDRITTVDIERYMTWRSKAMTQANRELALLSILWRFAHKKGLTTIPSICSNVDRFEEKVRGHYVEDKTLVSIWKRADWAVRDALELAYLTAQRPSDVLKFTEKDIDKVKGFLLIQQGKTKKKLRIELSERLSRLLARIQKRKAGVENPSKFLIVDDKGREFKYFRFNKLFKKARLKAAEVNKDNHELRDAILFAKFKDMRSKAATDIIESDSVNSAQKLLGHSDTKITEIYRSEILGQTVKPTA